MSGTDRRAAQPLALDVDVPVVIERDLRAHRLEPLEVLIDRPRSDVAPARHRHPRPPVPRHQWPEHEHALARIVRTRSATAPRAWASSCLVGGAIVSDSVPSTVHPSMRSSFAIVRTSASCGTLRYVDVPVGRSAAASSGNAAFLAPLTGILPTRRAPPSTTILSMATTSRTSPARRLFADDIELDATVGLAALGARVVRERVRYRRGRPRLEPLRARRPCRRGYFTTEAARSSDNF